VLRNLDKSAKEIVDAICAKLEATLELPALIGLLSQPDQALLTEALDYLSCPKEDDPVVWGPRLVWVFSGDLGRSAVDDPVEAREVSRSWIDEWLLGKITAGVLKDMGLDESNAWRSVRKVKLLVRHSRWCLDGTTQANQAAAVIEKLLQDADVQQFIGSNRYQGVLWFNKESFEDLMWWLFQGAVIEILAEEEDASARAESILGCFRLVKRLQEAAEKSDFQLAKLAGALSAK